MAMENIEHIVYLMLENRSLDNVLGWLYEKKECANTWGAIPEGYKNGRFEGLQTGSYYNPVTKEAKAHVTPIRKNQPNFQTIPNKDPHEEFEHVQTQIGTVNGVTMGGFYQDFATVDGAEPHQIMQCYTPESLPIINWLAKNFAVSDAYFSSIPTQTNCNRAFSLTGNSIGYRAVCKHKVFDKCVDWGKEIGAMVNNEWHDDGDPYEFTEKTIWNALNENGHTSVDDWMVFYSQTWPGFEFREGSYCYTQDLVWPNLGKHYDDHFNTIDNFYSKVDRGTLPRFSFLEPLWFLNGTRDHVTIKDHNGNSYHPPADLAPGEELLHKLYTKLKSSPKWDKTLLIINFDEHGGTYDHIVPPDGVKTPWADSSDGTSEPSYKEANFTFDRLGVRVPLILVSPLINAKTVFRSPDVNTPFDHTSVIATILEWFDIPRNTWQLGSRTANAKTFGNIVQLETPRVDIPSIPEPLPDQNSDIEYPPSDLQLMIARRILTRAVHLHKYPKDKFQAHFEEHFKEFNTVSEMNDAIKKLLDLVTKKASGKPHKKPKGPSGGISKKFETE